MSARDGTVLADACGVGPPQIPRGHSTRKRLRLSWLVVAALAAASPALAAPATTLDRCIGAIASDVNHFVDKQMTCLRACEDGVRRGTLPATTRCESPSTDPATARCLERADHRLEPGASLTSRRCSDEEVRLYYGPTETCRGENSSAEAILACLARGAAGFVSSEIQQIYHPQPSPVCGDGIVNGYEMCDPGAPGEGICSFVGATCDPTSCQCNFPYCGNGTIDSGEDCDYAAYPDGCSFDRYCNSSCSCRSFGSASRAFVAPPADLLD